MNINIVKQASLTDKQINDIEALIEICNIHDNTKYIFDECDDFKKDNDINTFLLYADNELFSVINIFAPKTSEAELLAFSKPEIRRNGYFNKLMTEVKTELERRNINSVLYVCDVNSADGKNTLKKINAEYEFSEFLMGYTGSTIYETTLNDKIKIAEADYSDLDRLTAIHNNAFNIEDKKSSEFINDFFKSNRRKFYSIFYDEKITGMICVYSETGRQYICGFAVDPEYQGKGIGKQALTAVVQQCLKNNNKLKIALEVETNNENALKLYKDTGFEVETEFRYYRKMI
jgi:ribosomal protein S18 acetylase RimI-like enzyme